MAEMTVIEHGQGGGPEVLVPGRRPVPAPGPGEVLVRVTAAGVNGPDVMQRQGLYPAPPGASDLLGLEVSGEVIGLGEGVARWEVGDRVCALTKGGGYAEYVTVDAAHCLAIPPGVSDGGRIEFLVEASANPDMTSSFTASPLGDPATARTIWSAVDRAPGRPPEEFVLATDNSAGINAAHPFHIHVNPFEVVEEWIELPGGQRQSVSTPRVWRDTLILEQGHRYRIRTRIERFVGTFVHHCHILDHEDQGMMQRVTIVDPAGGDTPDTASADTASASVVIGPAPAGSRRATRKHRPSDPVGRRPTLSDVDASGKPKVFLFVIGVECEHCLEQMKAFAAALDLSLVDLVVLCKNRPLNRSTCQRVSRWRSTRTSRCFDRWAWAPIQRATASRWLGPTTKYCGGTPATHRSWRSNASASDCVG